MGQLTNLRMHEFATKQNLLRSALEFHQDWIETTVGVSLSQVVIFQTDLDLAQIGREKILACSNQPETSEALNRLIPVAGRRRNPEGLSTPC